MSAPITKGRAFRMRPAAKSAAHVQPPDIKLDSRHLTGLAATGTAPKRTLTLRGDTPQSAISTAIPAGPILDDPSMSDLFQRVAAKVRIPLTHPIIARGLAELPKRDTSLEAQLAARMITQPWLHSRGACHLDAEVLIEEATGLGIPKDELTVLAIHFHKNGEVVHNELLLTPRNVLGASLWKSHFVLLYKGRVFDFNFSGKPGTDVHAYLETVFGHQRDSIALFEIPAQEYKARDINLRRYLTYYPMQTIDQLAALQHSAHGRNAPLETDTRRESVDQFGTVQKIMTDALCVGRSFKPSLIVGLIAGRGLINGLLAPFIHRTFKNIAQEETDLTHIQLEIDADRVPELELSDVSDALAPLMHSLGLTATIKITKRTKETGYNKRTDITTIGL
jgi:hypothetical protein